MFNNSTLNLKEDEQQSASFLIAAAEQKIKKSTNNFAAIKSKSNMEKTNTIAPNQTNLVLFLLINCVFKKTLYVAFFKKYQ